MRIKYEVVSTCLFCLLVGISSTALADTKTESRVTTVTGTAALGHRLKVKLEGDASSTNTQIPGFDDEKIHQIILYLNDYPINKLYPAVDHINDTLEYELDITADSRDSWAKLLGHPDGFTRPLKVSVGLEGESGLDTDVNNYSLIVLPKNWFWVSVILILGAFLLFIVLAIKSNMLRDGQPAPGELRKPYSLARTQMAFWFFLVIASYLFIWLITGERDTITEDVLVLIGISAATALGAKMIDTSTPAAADQPKHPLLVEKESLETERANLQTSIKNATTAEEKDALTKQLVENSKKLADVNRRIAEADKTTFKQFLLDLLSGEDGVSFHRFQIFVWTLVLGVIFVNSVYYLLAMPDFNPTLLALMGISSGTYLGFKIPEQKAS
jgi:hypothetical protein